MWGRVQSCHAPSRRGSSPHLPTREALWTLSLGSYGSFSTLAPLITSVAMGDGFSLQPLCPPCRSGWDWKFQLTWWFSLLEKQGILVAVIEGLSKITSLMEQKALWLLSIFRDSRVSRGSVQETGVRPSVCFFLEITAPQLVSQKQRQRHKLKKVTYFKMLFDRKADISGCLRTRQDAWELNSGFNKSLARCSVMT